MTESGEIFTCATPHDVDGVMALIRQRMEWLRGRGIDQWREAEYSAEYPREYFERCAVESRLFVLKRGEALCGCMVLSESDPVWDDGAQAIYFHNLAASPEWPGTGRRLMLLCEHHALALGKRVARLDCQSDNHALCGFYLELGYRPVGSCANDHYTGTKMEKRLL